MQKHKHLIGIDVLRLIAATLVMCYHLAFWNWLGTQPLGIALPGQVPAWGPHLHFGWVGVEIFFVISGFVIAYTVSDTSPARFLRSRFLRLAPASWIAATLVLIIYARIGHAALHTLLTKYAETLAFWPLDAIDGIWWTLGIEIDFYLLAYFLILKRRPALLEPVIVSIGLASGAFWIMALSLQTLLNGRGGYLGLLHYLVLKAEGNRELQLLLVQHGCLFATGVVLWKVSSLGLTKRRAGVLLVLVAACLLEIAGQNGIIARAARMHLPALPAMFAWGAAMGLLCVSVIFNDTLLHRIGRGAATVRFAGLLTYPLYLLHDAVGTSIVLWLSPSLGAKAIAAAAVISLGCAACVAGYVEPALRSRLSALLPGNARRRPAEAS